VFRLSTRIQVETFYPQEICYRMKRYDVRGTLTYVEKGCRAVTSCTTNMYSGLCDGRDCVRCIDNRGTCSGHKGKSRKRPRFAKKIATELYLSDKCNVVTYRCCLDGPFINLTVEKILSIWASFAILYFA